MRLALPAVLLIVAAASATRAAAPDLDPRLTLQAPAATAGCRIDPKLLQQNAGALSAAQAAVSVDLARLRGDYAAVTADYDQALADRRRATTTTRAAAGYDTPGSAAQFGDLYAAQDDEGQALADIARADASAKAAAPDRQALDTAETSLLALLGCAPRGG